MAPNRSGSASASRWAAVGVVSVLLVTASGLTGTAPAVALSRAGHLLYDHTIGAIVDIDGGSKSVAQKVPAPGLSRDTEITSAGNSIVAIDPRTGRMTTFGRSDARVRGTQAIPREKPQHIETALATYVLFPKANLLSRLGDHKLTVSTRGTLTTPIGTSDGTFWAQRPSTGEVCRLTPRGRTLTCYPAIPDGHTGQLVTLDDKPVLVDRTASTFRALGTDGVGRTVRAAEPLPTHARIASADAGGRLAMLVPQGRGSQLVLLDTSAVGTGTEPVASAPIAVPAGDYDPPLTAGGSIVLVNQSAHTVATYDVHGNHRGTASMSNDAGPLRASRGQDGRVYVDNRQGTRTTVVDGDGTMTPVASSGPTSPVGGRPVRTNPTDPSTPAAPSGSRSGTPSESPSDRSTTTSGRSGGSAPSAPPSRSSTRTRTQPGASPDRPRTTDPDRTTASPGPGSKRKPRSGAGDRPGSGSTSSTSPPKKPKAEVPDAPPRVDATAGTTAVSATWSRPAANGAALTGYRVTLRSGGKQIGTKTVAAGTRRASFAGLAPGTRYVVTVAARNRVGLGPNTSSDRVSPRSAPTRTCRAAVLAGRPAVAYPLDETDRRQATDVSGNGRSGSYAGGVKAVAGPCGTSVGQTLDGTGYVTSDTTFANPTAFTQEVWFRTTSTSGGPLTGFSSTKYADGKGNYDRHVWMTGSGQLIFGVYNGPNTIEAASSGSYNDGRWHLMAASLGANGMNLYVDGALVGHNANTLQSPPYECYFHVGYSIVTDWPNGSSNFFNGAVAYASMYTRELPAAEIAGHYRAGA